MNIKYLLTKNKKVKQKIFFSLSLIPVFILLISGYVVYDEFVQKSLETSGIDYLEFQNVFESKNPVFLVLNVENVRDKNQDYLQIDVGNVFIIEKNLEENICVTGIYIRYPQTISSSKPYYSFKVQEPDFFLPDLCGKAQSNSQTVQAGIPLIQNQFLTFDISNRKSEHFYPFDERNTGTLFLWLEVQNESGERVNIKPDILVNTTMPNWDSDVKLNPVKVDVNSLGIDAYKVDITLNRLKSIRFFVVLLLAVSFFIITAILFVKSTSTAIELLLAILLGLWGMTDILIPDSIQTTTLPHLLIISLYIYMVLIVGLWINTLNFFKKKCHIWRYE